MEPVERERAGQLIAWAIAILGCLVALWLAACNTIEAAGQMPEGYWVATESLVMAVIEDVWSVIRLLLPI